MSNLVHIAVGSNIDPEENVQHAVDLLNQKATIKRISPVYVTPPAGYAAQADFLNMAVLIETAYSAAELRYEVLDWIEDKLGRVRDPNNKAGPRTIDLDIALWNDEQFSYGHKPWHVPHADVSKFAHTAIPLADISPQYRHPVTGHTLQEIASTLPTEGITRHGTLTFSTYSD
jgi:2-amino-4-hydroxy-6-hydroxymethyldihydropteridine diphosphokinase